MEFGGEPIFVEVPDKRDIVETDGKTGRTSQVRNDLLKDGGDFLYCIQSELQSVKKSGLAIIFVLLNNPDHKKLIKKALDKMGLASQFMLKRNIEKKLSALGVFSNLLRQVNAKCGMDLYRLQLHPKLLKTPTMIVGVDVHNMGTRSIVGMAASYSRYLTQHYSKIAYQHLHKEKIGNGMTKDQQEETVAKDR